MSSMQNIADIEVAVRVIRRAPLKTNPLKLTASEISLLQHISGYCEGKLCIRELSTSNQVNALYSAVISIDALRERNWQALTQTVIMGLRAIDNIQGVSAYIFSKQDGALRQLVSDERQGLKDMALRLGAAAECSTREDIDTARILRALVCAAIAAERGLIHLAKENFGVVIRTLNDEQCPMRNSVAWTDELVGYSRRHARAQVKMP